MLAGLDLSNTYCGLSAFESNFGACGKPRLLELASVRGRGGADPVGTALRVIDRLQTWRETHNTNAGGPPPPFDAVIERPPGTVRDDVEHGKQADIGFALGRLIGHVESPLLRVGHRVRLVDVTPWREAMIVQSNRWGVPAMAPGNHGPLGAEPTQSKSGWKQAHMVERVAHGLAVAWSGCGHKTATTLGGLRTFPYRRCPTCEGLPLLKMGDAKGRAEWKTAAWKALACRLTQAHYPEHYQVLVDDARSRARVEQEDYQLAGVADACESVWIGISALDLA